MIGRRFEIDFLATISFSVINKICSLGIESNGDITVNFPEQNRWTGLLAEMERVEPSESNVTANPPSPQLGSFDSATVAATLQGRLSLIISFSIYFC